MRERTVMAVLAFRALWLAVACPALMIPANVTSAEAELALGQARLGNVFRWPELVTIPVVTSAERVRWVLTDHSGATVARGKLQITGGKGALVLSDLPLGYFEIEFTAELPPGSGPSVRTSLVLLDGSLATEPDQRFGVATHFAQGWDTDIIPLIRRAGIGFARDEQYWNQIERTSGKFVFPDRFRDYMAELGRHRIEPLIVLSFANPLYDDGLSPHSAAGRAGFAHYARAVAERYGDQIKAVEVWNEYNGTFCEGPCKHDRAGYYTPMLQRAYNQIKAVRPEVTVAGGAAVKIPLPYLEAVFGRGGLAAMDAVVVHPYGSSPEGVAREIFELRALMRRYGAGREKPIWATEIGHGGPTPEERLEAARFLVRIVVALLSAGVERIGWYLLRDDRNFLGMGLLRRPDSDYGRYAPAPAYAAYAQLIRRLGGTTFIRREPTDRRAQVYTFAGADGEVRVAWSPHEPVLLELRAEQQLWRVDIMGRATPLAAVDGVARLLIGPEPVYIVGDVASLTDHWPDRLIADSVDDYSDVQGAGGWYYGQYDGDGTGEGHVAGAYTDGDFELMKQVADSWGHHWGDPRYPWLSLDAQGGHPSSTKAGPVWSVRRWISDRDEAIRLRGQAAVAPAKGDGVTALIIVDGRVARKFRLGGAGNPLSADYDLEVKVRRGSTVDFALTPGPGADIQFDRSTFVVQITDRLD
jgi:hypothetical protein